MSRRPASTRPARRDAWQLACRLRSEGTTILLTTHAMDEAQALADRVVLLYGGLWWRRTGRRPASAGATPNGPASPSRCRAGPRAAGVVQVETGRPTETWHQLTDWALRRGTVLAGLTVDRPSLEDVYLQLTGTGADAPEGTTR